MKCENCGKNEATITYNQNINGKVTSINLCEDCARALNIFSGLDDIFSPMILDLGYILPEEVKCEKCGYTLSKYRETGLFGCDECYKTFKKEIDEILLRLQGKNRNIVSKRLENKNKVEEKEKVLETKEDKVWLLKKKLQKLVEEENFEEAANVRDEIKKIESEKEEK